MLLTAFTSDTAHASRGFQGSYQYVYILISIRLYTHINTFIYSYQYVYILISIRLLSYVFIYTIMLVLYLY